MEHEDNWLALAIGNSRLHWAWYCRQSLIKTWNTPYLGNHVKPNQLPPLFLCPELIEQGLIFIPVYLASVVSSQTQLWQKYHKLNLLSLTDIQLTNIYSTIGIDRALAAWGAIATYQQSCLVIDGGTALTFTAVDKQGKFIGGAILPGLSGQLATLKQKTAALPQITLPDTLPPRWADNTEQAIASGIIYTTISGIQSFINDWWRQFTDNQVLFTGGDAKALSLYLYSQFPELKQKTIVDPNLIFHGIKLVYEERQKQQP